jgi:hypothetical protein
MISSSQETTHLPEIVHIIPLGHEFDRAIRIFEKSWVSRVYLLSLTESKTHDPEMTRKQVEYTKRVQDVLKQKKIEVKSENVNMFDILEVMKHVASIILKEKKEKNFVHVNMSACGRLTSIGATLAAMAHDAIVYYVIAERYSESPEEIKEHGLSICEKGEIIQLHNFQLLLPEEESVRIILKTLLEKSQGLKTKDIEERFIEAGIEGFTDYRGFGKESTEKKRTAQIGNLMKLKGILDKLEKDHYIKRAKVGRYNTIDLTNSGKYVAYISGLAD